MKTQESLQRSLCRATVLLCAVVPVLCLMAASVYWKLPWVRNAEAQAIADLIGDSCGVIAKIDSVRHLSPRRLEIHNLTILHPETSQTLIEVPLLNAQRYASQWEISADTSQCAVDQLLKLSRMAHDRFLCRADERLASVHIIAKSTNVLERDQSLWRGDAEMTFTPGRQKTTLTLSFFPEGDEQQLIGVQFDRNRERPELLQTSTQLVASKIGLPTRLLKEIIPNLDYLGNNTTFEGTAVWYSGQHDKLGLRNATVRDVQWDSITNHMAFQVSGQGSIHLEDATLEAGRIQTARGTIVAIDGTIPNQWLDKAMRMFGLRTLRGRTLGPGLTQEFRDIQLRFELDAEGARLYGGKEVHNQRARAILSDVHGPFIFESEPDNNYATRPLSMVELVDLMCSVSDSSISPNAVTPAAYQTPRIAQPNTTGAYLMTVLPLPVRR